MATAALSPDDELLARLQAPLDLHDGLESLVYWRGRRARLPWYRRGARREAARMIIVWERRVGAALLQQPAVSFAVRFGGARLIVAGRLGRSFRRVWLFVRCGNPILLYDRAAACRRATCRA